MSYTSKMLWGGLESLSVQSEKFFIQKKNPEQGSIMEEV